MKRRIFLLLMFCLFFMIGNFSQLSLEAAGNDETETGISFEKGGTSGKTDPTNPRHDPVNVDKPTVKKGGYLPLTGELAQPVILILLGCLLITIIYFIFGVKKDIDRGGSY